MGQIEFTEGSQGVYKPVYLSQGLQDTPPLSKLLERLSKKVTFIEKYNQNKLSMTWLNLNRPHKYREDLNRLLEIDTDWVELEQVMVELLSGVMSVSYPERVSIDGIMLNGIGRRRHLALHVNQTPEVVLVQKTLRTKVITWAECYGIPPDILIERSFIFSNVISGMYIPHITIGAIEQASLPHIYIPSMELTLQRPELTNVRFVDW